MDLHRKKTEIKKIHHINLKHNIPNIKKIHLNNYVNKANQKTSSKIRKMIETSNNQIFKTTNISNPLQKKIKKINEPKKGESKEISEENLHGKSKIIILKQGNAFKNLHLNPKMMYKIFKYH